MASKKGNSKKFSLKKLWSILRPNRKTDADLKGVEGVLPSTSRVVKSHRTDGTVTDLHEIDKDRIRTCCPEALMNPPEFPSKEEVKERIENAHKYYGIKCVYNHYGDSSDPDKELQPTWYYILERPLVEQYVLMNNYIRKLSVMASLKKEQSGVEEEPAIEEEVSSISSSSDYSDFAPNSKIAAKLKEMKKLGRKSSPSEIGVFSLDRDIPELKSGVKSEERTIKTNEYTIIIREPADDEKREETKGVPSPSNAIEFPGESHGQYKETEAPDLHSSGDHLPDMRDFDLSHNLVDGPVVMKTGFGRPSYYHWQGNSTPTKTPLLNMDCQPPVRPRAPGTARDFLTFRSLSLSSEFVDSCRDFSVSYAEECRSACMRELADPGDSDDGLDGRFSSGTQTDHRNGKPVLSLGWDFTERPSALPEANPIGERAALASEYNRECVAESVGCIGHPDSEETGSVDASSWIASHNADQFEEDLLRSSVSQVNITVDTTESESSTSVETKVPAAHAKVD